MLSIGLMDYLTDEMQKLNFGRKFCCCKLWKQKDMYWYDYACAYVDGKSYDEVDDQTKKDIKQSFLMLSIQSGFFGFTKVQTTLNIWWKIRKSSERHQLSPSENYILLCQ